MNCYGGKELAESFRTVRKNTIVVAEEVPEEKYGFRAFAEGRGLLVPFEMSMIREVEILRLRLRMTTI